MVVGVGESEMLGEVDNIFQRLIDRMELPLFLRGVFADGERERLSIIPTFT